MTKTNVEQFEMNMEPDMTESPNTKKQRTFQKTDAAHIERIRRNYDMSSADIAKIFGVSDTIVSAWLRQNIAPKWTLLACEALNKRHNNKQDQLFVLKIPGDKTEAVKQFLNAMQIEWKSI